MPNFPNFLTETPLSLPSPSSPSNCRRFYQFRLPDKISDCPTMTLRNTGAFLAVLAFVREAGEGFYLLSGSGMTVARCRSGSASASERSKVERKLWREIFDPLKRAGAEDPMFLALLAVAKKFVVLGSLGTKEEVERYLFAVSKVLDARLSSNGDQLTWSARNSSLPAKSSSSSSAGSSKTPPGAHRRRATTPAQSKPSAVPLQVAETNS